MVLRPGPPRRDARQEQSSSAAADESSQLIALKAELEEKASQIRWLENELAATQKKLMEKEIQVKFFENHIDKLNDKIATLTVHNETLNDVSMIMSSAADSAPPVNVPAPKGSVAAEFDDKDCSCNMC